MHVETIWGEVRSLLASADHRAARAFGALLEEVFLAHGKAPLDDMLCYAVDRLGRSRDPIDFCVPFAGWVRALLDDALCAEVAGDEKTLHQRVRMLGAVKPDLVALHALQDRIEIRRQLDASSWYGVEGLNEHTLADLRLLDRLGRGARKRRNALDPWRKLGRSSELLRDVTDRLCIYTNEIEYYWDWIAREDLHRGLAALQVVLMRCEDLELLADLLHYLRTRAWLFGQNPHLSPWIRDTLFVDIDEPLHHEKNLGFSDAWDDRGAPTMKGEGGFQVIASGVKLYESLVARVDDTWPRQTRSALAGLLYLLREDHTVQDIESTGRFGRFSRSERVIIECNPAIFLERYRHREDAYQHFLDGREENIAKAKRNPHWLWNRRERRPQFEVELYEETFGPIQRGYSGCPVDDVPGYEGDGLPPSLQEYSDCWNDCVV